MKKYIIGFISIMILLCDINEVVLVHSHNISTTIAKASDNLLSNETIYHWNLEFTVLHVSIMVLVNIAAILGIVALIKKGDLLEQ